MIKIPAIIITAPARLFLVGDFFIISRRKGTIRIEVAAKTLAVEEESLSIPNLSNKRFKVKSSDKNADFPKVAKVIWRNFFQKIAVSKTAAIPQVMVK